MRDHTNRRTLAGGVLLILAIVVGLLTTGDFAFGRGEHAMSSVKQARATGKHSTAPALAKRSQRTVRLHRRVDGVSWTASVYRAGSGWCLEIAGSGGGDGGSVGHCSDLQPFTWGVGDLNIRGTNYRIVYGTAPAAAAALRFTLGDGATHAAAGLQNGVWFDVYPAAIGSSGDDVEQIEVLAADGHRIAVAGPARISAYERAAHASHTNR